MDATSPKVFISYSWDSDEHKAWVVDLATRLRSNGVDAILDRWNVRPGEELPAFMEASIRESNFVVLICTPKYKAKADTRRGGVGYEGGVITGEVMTGVPRYKFVPVLREGSWPEAAPSWCVGSLMIDLREDPNSSVGFEDLLDNLLGTRPGPPPLGSRSSGRQSSAPNSESSLQRSRPASALGDKATEWSEVKRLIGQDRPVMRQVGLNRWDALSASKIPVPPDVIETAKCIIIATATEDDAAYSLLLKLTTIETPESHRAITQLTCALAEGAFVSRPKTGLNLAYAATGVPEAREHLFEWLEDQKPEREVELGLTALAYFSQVYSPDLERAFPRIERICRQYPGNVYAQRVFKLVTGKELSLDAAGVLSDAQGQQPSGGIFIHSPVVDDGGIEEYKSLNVPRSFNLNAARYRAASGHKAGGDHVRRIAELEIELREQQLVLMPRLVLGTGSLHAGKERKQSVEVRNGGKALFSIASARCSWRLHTKAWHQWLESVSVELPSEVPPFVQQLRIPPGTITEGGKANIGTASKLEELEKHILDNVTSVLGGSLPVRPDFAKLLVAEVDVMCQGVGTGRTAVARIGFSWEPGMHDSGDGFA